MKRGGFTLLEVLIALALIATLAGLMVPLGARLGSSSTRIDAALRREDALGRVLDLIDASLLASDPGDLRFSSTGFQCSARIVTHGSPDALARAGAARPASLSLTDGTLVYTENESNIVVEGISRIAFSARHHGDWSSLTGQLPSHTHAIRLRVWFSDAPTPDDPDQPPLPDAERVFLLLGSPTDSGAGEDTGGDR